MTFVILHYDSNQDRTTVVVNHSSFA